MRVRLSARAHCRIMNWKRARHTSNSEPHLSKKDGESLIMVGSRIFVWLQRFPGLDSTRRCTAENHRELVLDRGRSVRYAQEL